MSIKKIFLIIAFTISFTILFVQLIIILEIELFELPYVYHLFGLTGIVIYLIFDIGLVFFVWQSWEIFSNKKNKIFSNKLSKIYFFVWLPICFWIVEWLFMPVPLTLQIKKVLSDKKVLNTKINKTVKLENFSLIKCLKTQKQREEFSILYRRIILNRPSLFKKYNIGKIIDKYAKIYQIQPVILFYWLYLTSFYGEATSGKIPFFRAMTGETFRDFVQVHLPWWFIENPIRKWFITSDFWNILLGNFGQKLRYAFQKATYDVSLEPYDTNIFSDVFLVLKEYKQEFPEIFNSTNSNKLDMVLKETFLKLENNCLIKPYEFPYKMVTFDWHYYQKNRRALISFAKAVFYKMLFNFDFATKIQALVVKYYIERYKHYLGQDFWNQISLPQKIVLLAILRDVYIPNIGKLSYNLYALPEFNCTPIIYVTKEALKDKQCLLNRNKIWLPKNLWKLWGAGCLKLTVLAETWEIIYQESLPGIKPANTIKDSFYICLLN